jgi:hypothetical protein
MTTPITAELLRQKIEAEPELADLLPILDAVESDEITPEQARARLQAALSEEEQ